MRRWASRRNAARPAQLLDVVCFQFQPQEPQHLGVAVLVHDVNSIVAADEVADFQGERVSTQAAIAGLDILHFFQLIEGFQHRPVACAISNDAHLTPAIFPDHGLGSRARAVSNFRTRRSMLST